MSDLSIGLPLVCAGRRETKGSPGPKPQAGAWALVERVALRLVGIEARAGDRSRLSRRHLAESYLLSAVWIWTFISVDMTVDVRPKYDSEVALLTLFCVPQGPSTRLQLCCNMEGLLTGSR